MADISRPLPVSSGDFLLPAQPDAMRRWPVIACDQHTAQPDYWEEAAALTDGSPSALRLILPEAYLGAGDEARIELIHQTMRQYLHDGVLAPLPRGMVLVERATESGVRPGLVVTVDLEKYDFEIGAKAPIRPTEGTVRARIPPRLRVRAGAALELSHVLLLLDDPQKTVIEPLYALRNTLKTLYDTELMLGGGHIRGWLVPEGALTEGVLSALDTLRAHLPADAPLIAVGDGNHSLATARAHWLNVKKGLSEAEQQNHPARFAMAEIENLHCPALRFEPIHRLLFGLSAGQALQALSPVARCDAASAQAILIGETGDIPLRFMSPTHPLPVGTAQARLDAQRDIAIDYIHGKNDLRALVRAGKGAGLLLPPMDKALLFPAVAQGGVLPRKTFSMGEANEKRYYIEARCIL